MPSMRTVVFVATMSFCLMQGLAQAAGTLDIVTLSDQLDKLCDKNKDGVLDGRDWVRMNRKEKLTATTKLVSFAYASRLLAQGQLVVVDRETAELVANVTNSVYPLLGGYYLNPRNRKSQLLAVTDHFMAQLAQGM